MRKVIITTISLLFLISCSTSDINTRTQNDSHFKKEHYEYITQVKLPADYKFITTRDSDFVSITILDLSRESCLRFSKINQHNPKAGKFEPIRDTFPQTLIGLSYLKSYYRQTLSSDNLLRMQGVANATKWIYLLDTLDCRLYCQIIYPDYKGYTK